MSPRRGVARGGWSLLGLVLGGAALVVLRAHGAPGPVAGLAAGIDRTVCIGDLVVPLGDARSPELLARHACGLAGPPRSDEWAHLASFVVQPGRRGASLHRSVLAPGRALARMAARLEERGWVETGASRLLRRRGTGREVRLHRRGELLLLTVSVSDPVTGEGSLLFAGVFD